MVRGKHITSFISPNVWKFTRVAKVVSLFQELSMRDKRKERHDVVVPPHASQLVRHVIRILSIRMSLYPLLKNAVHHAVVVEEEGVIWGGSRIQHHSLLVFGNAVSCITTTNHVMNLHVQKEVCSGGQLTTYVRS